MNRLRLTLVAALLAIIPLLSRAEVTWICTLADDAVRLVCIAEHDPWRSHVVPAATARVHGTLFPLDPARAYMVDLWSAPTDWHEVERLAQATICHRSPDCTAWTIAPTMSVVSTSRPGAIGR